MNELKLRKATFRHVESEIYNYHETQKEILKLKNNILHASPIPDLNGGAMRFLISA